MLAAIPADAGSDGIRVAGCSALCRRGAMEDLAYDAYDHGCPASVVQVARDGVWDFALAVATKCVFGSSDHPLAAGISIGHDLPADICLFCAFHEMPWCRALS